MLNAHSQNQGQLFVIAAPSGAGKTSLVRALLDQNSDLSFSVSYTTRPAREGEKNGQDYFFVGEREFRSMIEAGEFLEYARVFDHYYGTSANQVSRQLNVGNDVVLEIDWQGAAQVRSNLPQCCSIFVLPPSVEELERRLVGRATDAPEVIRRRLDDALADMSHWAEFDYVLINDDLDETTANARAIIAGRGEAWRSNTPELRSSILRIVDDSRQSTA